MPVGRRGLVVPQNTFLENVVRRSNGLRKYCFIVKNAKQTCSINKKNITISIRKMTTKKRALNFIRDFKSTCYSFAYTLTLWGCSLFLNESYIY